MKVLSLRSSSLVENLIAMTIISLAIGMGMMIFIQLAGPGLRNRKMLEAQHLATEYFRKQELQLDLDRPGPSMEGFTTTVDVDASKKDLLGLHLMVLEVGSNRVIYERKRWYYAE